jgi:diacylglycerol kinase family enzyme
MYELVNGLMARPDADVAVRALRLGALPGGSANSLLTSFAKAAGEPIGPLSSARLLCRGGPQPLDLMRVTQPGRPVRARPRSAAPPLQLRPPWHLTAPAPLSPR